MYGEIWELQSFNWNKNGISTFLSHFKKNNPHINNVPTIKYQKYLTGLTDFPFELFYFLNFFLIFFLTYSYYSFSLLSLSLSLFSLPLSIFHFRFPYLITHFSYHFFSIHSRVVFRGLYISFHCVPTIRYIGHHLYLYRYLLPKVKFFLTL